MKAVHAYIRQSLAEHVIRELIAAGYGTMSVLEVRGIVDKQGVEGLDFSVHLAQRYEHITKIEIITSEADALRIAALISRVATTGHPGDGIVCVLPLDSITRIHS